MRTAGVPERNITGDASDWEKFAAWAATVPQTLRNPLYHWTHLELEVPVRRLGQAAGPDTAKRDLRALQPEARGGDDSRRRGCCAQYDVKVVCSTDDPIDDLEPHRRHAQERRPRAPSSIRPGGPTRRWRSTTSRVWNGWVDKLGAAAEHVGRQAGDAARGAAEAARLLSRRRLPRLGPRAGTASTRRRTPSARSEAIFAKARARQGRCRPTRCEKLRSALTLRLRGDGPQARLGAAVPPGRHAQQQHARDAHARARHRLRRHRRLPAGRGAGAVPRPPRCGRSSSPRPSSTT